MEKGDECEAGRGYLQMPANRLKKELQTYKTMEETSATENPLSWWKMHESSLPILSTFAKYYLCIPASSLASERVFSTSGLICSPLRSRLSNDSIDTLVFLSKNLQLTKELAKKQRLKIYKDANPLYSVFFSPPNQSFTCTGYLVGVCYILIHFLCTIW